MDNAEFCKVTNVEEHEPHHSIERQLDVEEDFIVNKYADYEPKNIPGIDFATGIDLIPLSKELVKCENEMAGSGLFSDYDKVKVKKKVSGMKSFFLKAVETTAHKELFSVDDEWLAKGSAMEGNMFPAIHELSKDEFIRKVLGDDPHIASASVRVLHKKLSAYEASGKAKKYLVQLSDIDIMVAPKCLQLREEKWMMQSNHPNYYHIELHGICNDNDSLLDEIRTIKFGKKRQTTLCPVKLRRAFDESLQRMCIYAAEEENRAIVYAPHGLAFQVVRVYLSENGCVIGEFYDLALAVTCKFWPRSANEWIKRKRIWPSEKEVEQISKDDVHLVAKSPTPDTDDLLWRYTFSKAEGSLSELPLVQSYALRPWGLVKSFLQGFNVLNKPNFITSYHIKTLFLYALERMPLDYWGNRDNTLKSIVSIIDELIISLATQECIHYFLPHVNLFERSPGIILPPEFFVTVAKRLKIERLKIVDDPMEYFFSGGHDVSADGKDRRNITDKSTPSVQKEVPYKVHLHYQTTLQWWHHGMLLNVFCEPGFET